MNRTNLAWTLPVAVLVASCGSTNSAPQSSADAADCLVRIFQETEGALAFCEQQCQSGNGYACYHAAKGYEGGRFGPADVPRATRLFEMACERENAAACYETALLADVANRPARAAAMYERACLVPHDDADPSENDAVARSCIEAGNAYDKKNDIETAAERFKRACDLGYSGPLIQCPFLTGF